MEIIRRSDRTAAFGVLPVGRGDSKSCQLYYLKEQANHDGFLRTEVLLQASEDHRLDENSPLAMSEACGASFDLLEQCTTEYR